MSDESVGRSSEPFEAAVMLRELDPSWRLEGATIRRELVFENFRDAFGFATRLALLAEAQGHHPDLEVGWGYVRVTLTTHSIHAVSENDFALAKRIDELV